MNTKDLLDRYERGLGSGGKTRTLYMGYARDFLTYSEGNFDRETISKYLDRLRRKKQSDGTVNFSFRVIRTLFNRNAVQMDAQGIEWPFRRGETPQIRESNVKAPALHPRTIERMVAAAREKATAEEQAYLALSTVYGLRRVEILELTNSDIKLKDRVIHIATAKHGRERSHIIPDEIVPQLAACNFNETRSEFSLLTAWYRLEYYIGLTHIDHVGFHSIRRTINTVLARHLSEITVKSFMRHKQRTSSDMTYRYSAITFVGEEEEETELASSAAAADKDVFAVHPFIELWR